MANQQDPKELEKIEKYLRASGLNAKELADRMNAIKNSTTEFNRELLNAEKHFRELNNSFDDLSQQFKNVLDDLKKMDSTSGLINKNFGKLGDIADKLKNDAKGYSDLNKKELESLQKKAQIELGNLKLRKQELDTRFKNLSQDRILAISQQTQNKELAKQASQYLELQELIDKNGQLTNDENNYLKTLLAQLDKRLEKEKQVEKAVGATGTVLKALGNIPGLGSLLDTGGAAEKMREEAKNLQDSGENINSTSNKLKIAGKGLSFAFNDLKAKLLDPVSLLTFFVQAGFKADKQITELTKSLGLSKRETMVMRADMAQFAATSGDAFLNADRLLKAQTELSQELGIAVKFSNEELATFAKLTELTGLTAKEAGKLALASSAAGISTEEYTDKIREGSFAAMQATNTHFSQKEIMQDIANLSAGIVIKFRGNVTALSAAVVEAKKLGATLEQIDKIGESLLNWESSIENELKAELLTGKQINLERARYAALTNDQLTLTREIASQVGSLAEYEKMNVLQQKALAEAFGMSKDEMSEMLMKQEAVRDYGEEAAQLNKEQLEDMKRRNMSASDYLQMQEQQRDAQTKFQDVMIKLQGIFANLVDGPIGGLLDALASAVEVAMKLLIPIGYLIKPIAIVANFIAKILDNWFILYPLIGIVALSYLPKLASGFGGLIGSIGGMGKGFKGLKDSIGSIFSGDGIKGFFGKIKEGFTGAKDGAKALAAAREKGLSDKQIAAGFGGKKAKEALAGKVKDKSKEAAEKGAEGAEKTTTAADKVKGDNAAGFKEKMQNIAEGIKAFADSKVLKGALTLIPASIGLVLFIPGVLGVKAVEQVKGEKFESAMKGIAGGISEFGKNVGFGDLVKLLLGGAALTVFAIGVPALLLLQLVNGKLIENTLGGIGRGIAAFSKSVSYGDLIKGAIAIALFGASLIPFAFALNLMAEVKMENILAAAAGLLIFGAAVIGLGTLMFTGIGAMVFGAGILAMIALGGAMMVLGAGLKVVSEGGKGIAQLFNDLSQLDADKLDKIAPSLKSIGEAVMYLGAGGVLSAIGKLLGGDSPVKMIQDIAASGDGLQKASTALQGIAAALTQVSIALAAIDTSKLKEIDKFASNRAEEEGGGIIGGITRLITTPIKAIGGMIAGSEGEKGSITPGGMDLSPLITAINDVKLSVDKLHNKNTTINMDGNKVGEITTQKSMQSNTKTA
jgi:hypothetical protein